jgi:hypothetical protein
LFHAANAYPFAPYTPAHEPCGSITHEPGGGTTTAVGVAERSEDAVSPTPFTAATLKKYCVPFDKPMFWKLVVVGPTVVTNTGDGSFDVVLRYTLNPVRAEPPFAGTFHDRSTRALPRVAVNDGADGTVAGVADCTVERVSPIAFTAATWKKYVVPLVSPVF